jgi:hypothetical protein
MAAAAEFSNALSGLLLSARIMLYPVMAFIYPNQNDGNS